MWWREETAVKSGNTAILVLRMLLFKRTKKTGNSERDNWIQKTHKHNGYIHCRKKSQRSHRNSNLGRLLNARWPMCTSFFVFSMMLCEKIDTNTLLVTSMTSKTKYILAGVAMHLHLVNYCPHGDVILTSVRDYWDCWMLEAVCFPESYSLWSFCNDNKCKSSEVQRMFQISLHSSYMTFLWRGIPDMNEL